MMGFMKYKLILMLLKTRMPMMLLVHFIQFCIELNCLAHFGKHLKLISFLKIINNLHFTWMQLSSCCLLVPITVKACQYDLDIFYILLFSSDVPSTAVLLCCCKKQHPSFSTNFTYTRNRYNLPFRFSQVMSYTTGFEKESNHIRCVLIT